MKRRKSIYALIVSLVSISLGLSSCIYNDTYEEYPASSPSTLFLTLTLPDAPRVSTGTRAGNSVRVDFSIVNNLNLILTGDGNIKHTYYFTGESINPDDGNVSMTRSDLPMTSDENNNKRTITIKDETGELLKGVDHIYAVANYGQQIHVNTVADLQALQQKQANGMPGKDVDCMMFGDLTAIENGQLKPNGEIQLKRTISMFSVKLNGSGLNDGVKITPTSISLHNVPTSCFIGKDNAIGKSATASVALGQQVSVDWGTLTKQNPILGGHESEPNTIPLFMFENLQGNEAKQQDGEIYKCPAEYTGNVKDVTAVQSFLDRTQKYSYIQIEAAYSYINPQNANDKIAGTIVYRFLLGDNIYNDFNVRRNTYYQVTLNLNGHGGASEDGKEVNGKLVVNDNDLSWRVDMNVRDWGFVKDKFDFDAHAETGTIDVIGNGWTVVSAKDENGDDIGLNSWLRFATNQGGTGWTEPTGKFYIGNDGQIKYYIQPMTYGVEFNDKTPVNKHRTITIEIKNPNGQKQTITFTQWVPIKITVGRATVFMERFEEEPLQEWGCDGWNLTRTVMISSLGSAKDYNFGTGIGGAYENGNAFYIVNGNLQAPAHLYCYNKSLVPSGAGGAEARYYVLPDQATLQAMIDYSKNNTIENMEPLHYEEDYWTSSAERTSPLNTIYWDGMQGKFISTNERKAKKRTRAIYATDAGSIISFN